jgi:hypothetical protein
LIFELDDLSISRAIVADCESSARGNPQLSAESRKDAGIAGLIHTEDGMGVEVDVGETSVDVGEAIRVGVTIDVAVAGAGVGGGGGVPHRDGWHTLRRTSKKLASVKRRGVFMTPQIILFHLKSDRAQ